MTHSTTHLSPATKTLIKKGNKYQIGDVVQNGDGQLSTIVGIYFRHKDQTDIKRQGWISHEHPCVNDPDWIFGGTYQVAVEFGEYREVLEEEISSLVKSIDDSGSVGF